MQVATIMTSGPTTTSPEASLDQALETMSAGTFRHLPVVDDGGNLVGILSEKDCLRLFANAAFNQLPGGDVQHYMSTELTTIEPDADIFRAAGVFLQNTYHRLPVLENDKLIGLISRRDVLEGSRHVWEESTVEKPWTDAKYLTDEIKAALE